MITAVASHEPEPFNYDREAARYQRTYRMLLDAVAHGFRNSQKIVGRKA